MSRDSELEQVLGDYRGWLARTASGMLRPGHPDLDDLVQEGYIAMWRAFGSFRGERGALPAWLALKARYRMLEVVRRRHWTGQSRRTYVPPAELPLAPQEDVWLLTTAADVFDRLGLAYHHGEIADAISALTPAQRRYVIARFWGGLSAAEMKAQGVFGYDASGLWTSAKNGARGKLAAALEHLESAV